MLGHVVLCLHVCAIIVWMHTRSWLRSAAARGSPMMSCPSGLDHPPVGGWLARPLRKTEHALMSKPRCRCQPCSFKAAQNGEGIPKAL